MTKDNEDATVWLWITILLIVCWALSGCVPMQPPPIADAGYVDSDVDDIEVEQCLGEGAECGFNAQCCSGACVYHSGYYSRCASAVRQQGVAPGFYQRQCQWDACNPPPVAPNPSFDPVSQ